MQLIDFITSKSWCLYRTQIFTFLGFWGNNFGEVLKCHQAGKAQKIHNAFYGFYAFRLLCGIFISPCLAAIPVAGMTRIIRKLKAEKH
ncbi:MAG: hypothetical protein ACLFPE_00730, partial [Bacteroidales bacterium]